MATRQLVVELAAVYQQGTGVEVHVESVGGVDAARRVQAGESFDLVILAADAIDKLAAGNFLLSGTHCAFADSAVAIAARAGLAPCDINSEQALRDAVLKARSIGYSTGPSGQALLQLFERWGLMDQLADKLVQAKPGVAVGTLISDGSVELGFQQLSELMHLKGIQLLGGMPPGLEIVTTFVAAVCSAATNPDGARALLSFICSEGSATAKRRHGMTAPGSHA